MSTTTLTPPLDLPSPDQFARLARVYNDGWKAIAPHDPEYAWAQKIVAESLLNGRFIQALLASVADATTPTSTPSALPPRRVHLVTGAQQAAAAARADEWLQGFLRDVLPEDGGTLPSNRSIFRAAARTDGLDLPRRVIERAIWRRWPEREGAPKK